MLPSHNRAWNSCKVSTQNADLCRCYLTRLSSSSSLLLSSNFFHLQSLVYRAWFSVSVSESCLGYVNGMACFAETTECNYNLGGRYQDSNTGSFIQPVDLEDIVLLYRRYLLSPLYQLDQAQTGQSFC